MVYLFKILTYSLLGCVAFSLLVIFLFRTGLVYAARKEDGTLKEKQTVKSALLMSIIPLGIIILQILLNYSILSASEILPTFWQLFILDYILYLVLFTFDTLVIDYLVISLWRPEFLCIPDSMNKESMRTHIRISIPVGLIFGLIPTLLSALISTYLLK